jgi:hypothetical protein
MKYRNKTDMDLIVAGRLVKGGETIESATAIENVNFEEITDTPAPVVPPAVQATPQAPQIPASTPGDAK